jgi:hypothetical protein
MKKNMIPDRSKLKIPQSQSSKMLSFEEMESEYDELSSRFSKSLPISPISFYQPWSNEKLEELETEKVDMLKSENVELSTRFAKTQTIPLFHPWKVNRNLDLSKPRNQDIHSQDIVVLIDHMSCPDTLQSWKRLPRMTCLALSEELFFDQWCRKNSVKSIDSSIKVFIHPGKYFSGVCQTACFVIGNMIQIWGKKNVFIVYVSDNVPEKIQVGEILKEFNVSSLAMNSKEFVLFNQNVQY